MSANKEWEKQSSAPRVAGPWTVTSVFGSMRYYRYDPYGSVVIRIISNVGEWYWSTPLEKSFVSGKCSYAEEAKEFADAYLLKQGWLIVT